MATHLISRRIQYLIQFVYDSHYPSKEKIIDFLENKDFIISSRTISRDLERIRTDYGLELLYDNYEKGYYINSDQSVKISSFFKFIELTTIADILSMSLKNHEKIFEFVSFDDSKSFIGVENLKPILIAIFQSRKLSFIHENFQAKTLKHYEITPLLLKEYENRWYVIGVPEGMSKIRTFGIDRMSKLDLKEFSKINKDIYLSKLKVFENIIGLDYESGRLPIKIRLLVDNLQVQYLKSLPIHHSQIIHSENEKSQYLVDYFLVPNYEFKSQILKMGMAAEILTPLSLRKEIEDLFQKALLRYKKN